MSFTVVIPARYASSRFPGKPLADLGQFLAAQTGVEVLDTDAFAARFRFLGSASTRVRLLRLGERSPVRC